MAREANGDHPIGGGDAGQERAMSRGEVAAGTGLAGEEQAIVDRFGECLTTVRTARQRERVRPAGKRVGSPAMDLDRADPTRERSSEQICQLGNGEVEEGPLSPPASSSEASLPPK